MRTAGLFYGPKLLRKITHPPFIFGGNTEAAMKRAARLGDGWYGVCHSTEEAAVLVKHLREIEKSYRRGNPLEISVVIGAVTADSVKLLSDLGVERIVGAVLREGEVPRDYIHGLHLFHDQVMTKF